MEPIVDARGAARLHVENVGGIDETDVSFQPGVTVLAGRNASNRTSLLQAVMAALGSDRASLKADADIGRVELELGGETYTRTLERSNGGVSFGGDPYSTGTAAADAFAFLLESNEARRAVARGDDLREVIMGPVDTDAVDAEIGRLADRKRELESGLDERDRLESRVRSLESELENLESQLAAKREAYEAKRIAIDEADAELEQSREREAELEEKLADLQSVRSSLETVRYRLDTQIETAERLRAERDDVEGSLSEVVDAPADELDELAGRINDLRARKRELDSKINQLQSLVQFNEEVLDGAGNVLDGLASTLDDDGVHDELDSAGDGDHDGHVTSQLMEGDERVCWTCGQATTEDDVEDTLDSLRDARQSLVADRRTVTASLEDARSRRDELRERERERSRLESRRESLEDQLADAESEIESLRDRRVALESDLEAEEAAVEELREDEYEEIVALHREANELELAVGGLEDDVAETRDQLGSAREDLDRLDEVEAELETVTEDLAAARTRIERLETEAVESFNEHMERVLEVLGYENVERVWIERTEREVREGRRTVTRGFFDLHVVRSTADDTVYEDTVRHLSESEREVTGLVFALAGYLTHEVHEGLPFVLLDSVEAIDAERIAALVEYLADVAGYLVVALLPEDAAAVSDDHPRISDI